jgi:hypothetical protein
MDAHTNVLKDSPIGSDSKPFRSSIGHGFYQEALSKVFNEDDGS